MQRSRRASGIRGIGRTVLVGSAVALAIVGSAPAGALTGPVRVLAGPEDQSLPAANDRYLIWTQNSEAHPDQDHAYGKVLGIPGRFRLNATGTRGYAGGFDPGQDRAIYQQIRSGASDLYLFNLETRNRSKLPTPVNSARWEWGPRISDGFIFFARDAQGMTSLFLYDRESQSLAKIGTWNFTRYYVVPGAVGDRYATWTVCSPLTCNAFVFDTDTSDRMRIPSIEGRAQYAPVVDELHSMMYFVRSGQACGGSVGIWRRPLDLSTAADRLVALPAGIDTGWVMSLDADVSQDRLDLWFSRYRCAPQQGDIYELRGLDTLS